MPETTARSLSADEFEELGRYVAKYGHTNSEKVRLRRFKAEFGVAPDVVVDAWDLLLESKFLQSLLNGTSRQPKNPEHLLWALMLLKQYSLTTVLAKTVKVDEKTFRKWSWIYLQALAELDRVVVRPSNDNDLLAGSLVCTNIILISYWIDQKIDLLLATTS